ITCARRALAATELEAPRGQQLADVIVQLARQLLAFLFLRRHQLLRQRADQPFGLFAGGALAGRSAFEDTQARDGDERDDRTQRQALPQQRVQLGGERGGLARPLVALRLEVGVVQLLDLLRDGQRRVAARNNVAAQELRAQRLFLDRRPVEERVGALPG